MPLRQVRRDPEEAVDPALGIDHGGHRELHGQPRAVLADVGPLADIVPSPCPLDEGGESLDPGAVLGRQLRRMRLDLLRVMNPDRRPADHLPGCVAEHSLGARVEDGDQPLRVGRDDRNLGGGVEHGVESGVDLGELGLGPSPLGEESDLPPQGRHGLQERLHRTGAARG